MIKNIIEVLKKYKISVYIALSIIIVGSIGLVLLNSFSSSKSKIKTYENENYILKYDRSWKLKEEEKNHLALSHNKNAKLDIEIIDLKDETKYSSIEDLIEEIVYNIEKQNPNYNLISKKETTLSRYDFKGYKLLYENKSSQVMISIYKKSDKLVMINYESDNEYFDILLDSVHNIIYNFDTKEKVYDLSNKITLNTSDVTYSTNEELDKTFEKTELHEIATNNYYVKYSVPSSFEISDFDSTRNYYTYRGLDKKTITISTVIYKYNVFEYLNKENQVDVYKNFDMYQKDKDYSDFKETLTKINSNKVDTYLYKNSYNYNKAVTYDKDFNKKEYKRKDENAVLIFALNKNHIMLVEIKATGTDITQKLIDSIKIDEIKNYSSYVVNDKNNDYLVSELKRYDGYDKKKITQIKINVPKKYNGYEKYNDNIYSDRYFGLNYDEDKNIYDYEIHYSLTPTYTKIEDKVKSINSSYTKSYGEYNDLTYLSEIELNNRKFIVYSGGYTQLGGIMFTNINRFYYYTNKKVLFCELDTGGYLVIEVSGNGKEVTDDILKDATNFEVNKIDN